jgi:hypothetical protein
MPAGAQNAADFTACGGAHEVLALAVDRFQHLYALALSPLDFLDDQSPRLIESRHPGLHVESANVG